MSFLTTNTVFEYLLEYIVLGDHSTHGETVVQMSHFPELIDFLLTFSVGVHQEVQDLLMIFRQALDNA